MHEFDSFEAIKTHSTAVIIRCRWKRLGGRRKKTVTAARAAIGSLQGKTEHGGVVQVPMLSPMPFRGIKLRFFGPVQVPAACDFRWNSLV